MFSTFSTASRGKQAVGTLLKNGLRSPVGLGSSLCRLPIGTSNPKPSTNLRTSTHAFPLRQHQARSKSKGSLDACAMGNKRQPQCTQPNESAQDPQPHRRITCNIILNVRRPRKTFLSTEEPIPSVPSAKERITLDRRPQPQSPQFPVAPQKKRGRPVDPTRTRQ